MKQSVGETKHLKVLKEIYDEVKYARDVKNILCLIIGNDVNVQTSDYNERKLEKLFPEILGAIQNKKKLLKY